MGADLHLTKEQRNALRTVFTGRFSAGGRGEMDPALHVPRYNCWGLVMAVTAILGHPAPEVKTPSVATARAVDSRREEVEKDFIRLDGPRPGCLVGLRTHPRLTGAVNHYGVMLTDREFVHIQRGTGVHIARIDRQPYNRMVAGFWSY